MKRLLLSLLALAFFTISADAQSRRLNRTHTKEDTARTNPNGTPRDMQDDKANPNSRSTTPPDKTPTTNDPNNPNNNTNGTSPAPGTTPGRIPDDATTPKPTGR